jgi:tetratricopeptide (TPR) repeat protein
MKRLLPAYRTGNRIYMHAPNADDLCIEVAIDALGEVERKTITKAQHFDVWAPAGASRYQFYRQRVADAFPDFDCSAATFSIGASAFHNPLLHLSEPLAQLVTASIEIAVGPAHGDLHPGNVLVVGTSPVIIDYGLSEECLPLGVDVARLFAGLVRNPFGALPMQDLANILSETLGLAPKGSPLESPSERARQLLEVLSKQAERVSGPNHSVLWPYHLYGAGFIGLKWSGGTTAEYRASFLLSAIALTKLLGRPENAGPALDLQYPQQPAVLSGGIGKSVRPEGPAEILVIVAEFSGRADFDPTARIYSSLADHVYELIPRLGRVERVMASVVSRKDAVTLASQYKASMIVWGTYDSFGVAPRYDVTRDSLVMRQALIQLDQATRHALGERFEPYVTHGLTEEIGFLSLIAIGNICSLNLSYDDAISVFQRALTLIPDPIRAGKLGAAQAYAALSGLFMVKGRHSDALDAITHARKLDSTNLAYKLQQECIQLHAGNSQPLEALRTLRDILVSHIPLAGDNADALRKVVATLDSIKSPTDLSKLLETPPPGGNDVRAPGAGQKDVVFHLNKAEAHYRQGQLSLALAEAKKALRINPRSSNVLESRARVLAGLGNVEGARRDLRALEQIDPRNLYTYAIRGALFWFADRDAAKTVAAYERAFALGYPKWTLDLDRAEALVVLGKDEDLMRELKRDAADPSDPDLFVARSMCYQRRGELSVALSEANQAASFWEMSRKGHWLTARWVYVRRGEARWASGDRQGAIKDFEQALSLVGEFALLERAILARLGPMKTEVAASGPISDLGSIAPSTTPLS